MDRSSSRTWRASRTAIRWRIWWPGGGIWSASFSPARCAGTWTGGFSATATRRSFSIDTATVVRGQRSGNRSPRRLPPRRTARSRRSACGRAGLGALTAEGESLANLVAGAGGREMAFVEKEFSGDKPGEGWLALNPGSQFAERLAAALALAPCERDVRMEGARLGHEAAKSCRCRDTLFEGEQLGSESNAGKEYPGAIEAAQSLKPHGNGRRTHFAQPRNQALVFLRAGIAQELQGDVPRFGRGPAQPVLIGFEPRRDRRKLADDRSRQGNPNKQTHTKIV